MLDSLAGRLLPTAVLASLLACGGGSGGGTSGPEVPGHQPSAEQATKLAGIGDSIMQGVDVTELNLNGQLGYSFAQGTSDSVFSLYSRYKLVSGLTGGEEFESRSGDTMINDALRQAMLVCDQVPLPNRVVILLGANDVCGALPSVGDFGAALQEALDELAGCLPAGSWVHVLSIPRVDHLYQAVIDKRSTFFNMSCPAVWSQGVLCPIVTGSSSAAAGTRIVGLNDGIASEVDTAQTAYASANGIEFTTDWKGETGGPSIGTFEFSADDVSSIDCFHPSIQGQKKLACAAWESWEGLGDAEACF